MRKFIPILIVLFILMLPRVAIAQESMNSVIDGQLINKSEDGSSVVDVEITLIPFLDGTQREILTTRTDGQGKFQFCQLSADYQYVLLVNYMEVSYYYQISFSAGETQQSIEVPVFDVTSSDQAIGVRLAHVLIYAEEKTFSVTEVFWLVNDSDRIYVGKGADTEGMLVFTLPPGATDFEAPEELMPDYLLMADNKVIYDVPFPPGERQLVYSYKLARPASGDYAVTLEIDYPTDEFHLLVEDKDVEVASTRLFPSESVVTGEGQSFVHLTGGNFLRDDVIEVRLSNLARGGIVVPVVLSVVAAVVILGIAFYLVKRKRLRPATSTAPGYRDDIKAQSKRLQQELTQLDDDYEQGLISEEVFRQARSGKNAQLKELGFQEKKESAGNE